jgi:hypothetical protein
MCMQCWRSGSACFGPPGSESVSQRYGSGSFPFLAEQELVKKSEPEPGLITVPEPQLDFTINFMMWRDDI